MLTNINPPVSLLTVENKLRINNSVANNNFFSRPFCNEKKAKFNQIRPKTKIYGFLGGGSRVAPLYIFKKISWMLA